jgi:hypothetical protein
MYPAFTFFSSSSDTFQSFFYFFDEFDYAIGYAIFLQKNFNFETYLPAMTVLAPYVQPCSSRKFMFK